MMRLLKQKTYHLSVYLLLVLFAVFALPYAASGDDVDQRRSAVIYITYETPNKNFLSESHQPISSEDMYELLYVGDGGTVENPTFPSIPDFYKKATNDRLQLVPAVDSQGRGPIIEVVVSDDYAISWDLYTNSSDPVRGSAAWSSFVNNVVMPKACELFNFYEFASTTRGSGASQVAEVTADDITFALVVSGYATATDQDHVWTTPNIHGGVGAPSIWGNSGSARSTTAYQTPADAKSLVSPDLNVANMGIRINSAYVTPSAATSPADNHFYSPRGFGVYAYEMGHSAFRFVDCYDVVGYYRVQRLLGQDIPYPMRAAVGNWSTMATGGYIFYSHDGVPESEFLRKYYNPDSGAEPLNFRPGLIDAYNLVERVGVVPVDLTDSTGNVLPEFEGKTITMQLGWDIYRLRTPSAGQYFLLQARADEDYDKAVFQWGRKYARPGDLNIDDGLVIMQVDNDYTDNSGNTGNQYYPLSRPYVVKEAHGGVQDLLIRRIYDRSGDEDKYNFGDPGDLFGKRVHDFGPNTSPSNRLFYSDVMSADLYATSPMLDAGYDPNRQITNFGAAANWHLSDITYHADSKTVSFKISAEAPVSPVESKTAKSDLTAEEIASLAATLSFDEIVAADSAEAYLYGLTAFDVTNDPSYNIVNAADGVEFRASVGEGSALLIDINLDVADGADYSLLKVFEPRIVLDILSAFPEYAPAHSGGKLTITALVIDNRPTDYAGVEYPTADPNYGMKMIELGGKQILAIYDGKMDGEASDPIFAVVDTGHSSGGSSSNCSALGASGLLSLLMIGAGVPLLARKRGK